MNAELKASQHVTCRPRVAARVVRVAFGLMTLTAFLMALMLGFLALCFMGAFDFTKLAHVGTFMAACAAPFFVAGAWGCYRWNPTRLTVGCLFAAQMMTLLTVAFWSVPLGCGPVP